MDIRDLTVNQLKRAAAIKEQIEGLTKQLRSILGTSSTSVGGSARKRTMTASAKRKIAAAQRARWLRRARSTVRIKPTSTAKKKTFSRATRAKLSAKLKAYWAAKRAGKK
jgi:hypothetical protein